MSSELVSFFGLSFLLGVRHAFDADHVAAVSTMVAEGGGVRAAARTGFLWGLGHTAMLLLAGLATLLFSLHMPGWLSYGLEACVGVMLVALGVGTLIGSSRHDTDAVAVPSQPLGGAVRPAV